jgi:PleD family two-component response regulator
LLNAIRTSAAPNVLFGRSRFRARIRGRWQIALERAQAVRPALVVAEILIPKIDGLALCRRLGEDPLTLHIPVLIFSILAAAVRANEAGAKAFLRKPLVESIFVATVQDLIAAQPIESRGKQWASQ